MIDIKLKFSKKDFTKSGVLIREINKRNKRALIKAGAYVRTVARRSIKTVRQGVSEPGNPPFSHNNYLKKSIMFDLTEGEESVIIGPVLILTKTMSPYNVTEALEHGNSIVRARPFMAPAGLESLSRINQIWLDSLQ